MEAGEEAGPDAQLERLELLALLCRACLPTTLPLVLTSLQQMLGELKASPAGMRWLGAAEQGQNMDWVTVGRFWPLLRRPQSAIIICLFGVLLLPCRANTRRA